MIPNNIRIQERLCSYAGIKEMLDLQRIPSKFLLPIFHKQRSIFKSTKTYCLFASMITNLWNVQVTSLFPRPLGHKLRPQILSLLLTSCLQLTVDYLLLTYVKEVSVYHFAFHAITSGFHVTLFCLLL